MNNLTILLAQTRGGSIIEILFLLIVAVIIGYVTAWFYTRLIYNKRISTVISERNKTAQDLISKNITISGLNDSLIHKDNEIDFLKKSLGSLKILHNNSVKDAQDMNLENNMAGQFLNERDLALVHIAKRKHLLNYLSFGIATEEEKDDLKMISGIGPHIEMWLNALDIYTFRQISKFTANDVETINEAIIYFSGRIERDKWVEQATEIVNNQDKWTDLLNRVTEKKGSIYYDRIGTATKEEADDLTAITGIGRWIKEKLNILDIYTFKQISNFTEEDILVVTQAIEYFPGRIKRDEWTIQAKELVRIEGKKSELYKRIRDKREKISLNRIGFGNKHDANNLTLINGISLWIEERLNMIDIYTFEQISMLNPIDEETITDMIEISPNSIERDKWVEQAQGLMKNNYNMKWFNAFA